MTTSTVELKTSRPGVTKTEQIKTGYSNVNDYSKYLQGKYHYMNTGTTSMQGVPTTVSVSSAFLQKCMNDPEKAKYLEENLAAIPDCAKSAVNGCLGTLTNLSYMIDANGNISVAISGTNDPDGKIAKENAERKAKDNGAEIAGVVRVLVVAQAGVISGRMTRLVDEFGPGFGPVAASGRQQGAAENRRTQNRENSSFYNSVFHLSLIFNGYCSGFHHRRVA